MTRSPFLDSFRLADKPSRIVGSAAKATARDYNGAH
jgi:hypothetical protein